MENNLAFQSGYVAGETWWNSLSAEDKERCFSGKLKCNIEIPDDLSEDDRQAFSEGIKEAVADKVAFYPIEKSNEYERIKVRLGDGDRGFITNLIVKRNGDDENGEYEAEENS